MYKALIVRISPTSPLCYNNMNLLSLYDVTRTQWNSSCTLKLMATEMTWSHAYNRDTVIKTIPWIHFTNNIASVIKIYFTLTQILLKWWLQNFAHDARVVLSWHVQKCSHDKFIWIKRDLYRIGTVMEDSWVKRAPALMLLVTSNYTCASYVEGQWHDPTSLTHYLPET